MLTTTHEQEEKSAHAYCIYLATVPLIFEIDYKQNYEYEETDCARHAW